MLQTPLDLIAAIKRGEEVSIPAGCEPSWINACNMILDMWEHGIKNRQALIEFTPPLVELTQDQAHTIELLIASMGGKRDRQGQIDPYGL